MLFLVVVLTNTHFLTMPPNVKKKDASLFASDRGLNRLSGRRLARWFQGAGKKPTTIR